MKKEPFQLDGGAREEEEEEDSADARAKRALDDFLQAGNQIEACARARTRAHARARLSGRAQPRDAHPARPARARLAPLRRASPPPCERAARTAGQGGGEHAPPSLPCPVSWWW